jgi:hypothetical protein
MNGRIQSVHVDQVEKVKTGHGMTKFLIKNEEGEGANIMIRYWGPETDIAVHSHPYDEMWLRPGRGGRVWRYGLPGRLLRVHSEGRALRPDARPQGRCPAALRPGKGRLVDRLALPP